MLQEVVLDMGRNVCTRSVSKEISTSDFKAQSDFASVYAFGMRVRIQVRVRVGVRVCESV